MSWRGVALVLLALVAGVPVSRSQSMVDQSVHNLSASGPAGRTYVSTDPTTGACIFCHAPHNTNAVVPLWNKQVPATNPAMYASSTYQQQNNPISQRSKLCLSCHDGTIALGQTVATGDLGIAAKLTGNSLLGTDLLRDHPISFNMPAVDDGQLASWLTTSPVISPYTDVQMYDGKLECRSCHDPHVPDNDSVVKKFLVRSNDGANLCRACHDVNRGVLTNFLQGAHATSTATIASGAAYPYATVGGNACGACHRSHNAGGAGARLLRSSEEAACSACHSSASPITPKPPDIMTALSATYKHPVTSVSGVHDPTEQRPVTSARHSECEDCHNPHTAQNGNPTAAPPSLPAALIGASGVSSSGASLATVTREYEVCFKCHGDSANRPQKDDVSAVGIGYGRATLAWDDFVGDSNCTTPAADRANLRKKFTDHTTYPSFHPVVDPLNRPTTGWPANNAVPSLLPFVKDKNGADITSRPLGPGSLIYCTDCHSSSGTSSNGPHGSSFMHLVERSLQADTNTPDPCSGHVSGTSGSWTANDFQMCGKCHDLSTNANTGLLSRKPHSHIGNRGAVCTTCHDPHAAKNPQLINFDKHFVGPYSDGVIRFVPKTSAMNGQCQISCHEGAGKYHSHTY